MEVSQVPTSGRRKGGEGGRGLLPIGRHAERESDGHLVAGGGAHWSEARAWARRSERREPRAHGQGGAHWSEERAEGMGKATLS